MTVDYGVQKLLYREKEMKVRGI